MEIYLVLSRPGVEGSAALRAALRAARCPRLMRVAWMVVEAPCTMRGGSTVNAVSSWHWTALDGPLDGMSAKMPRYAKALGDCCVSGKALRANPDS